MTILEALENRIAIALPADEPRLFADARAAFRTDTDRADNTFADIAIRLHRALLPSNGYQFGETANRRGFASTWHSGDAYAQPFEAATPALALLRAMAHAVIKQRDTDLRTNCPTCGGRGWTITVDGGKQVCGHATLGRPNPLNTPPRDPVAQQDRAADS